MNKQTLYIHQRHAHQPVNVNDVHAAERLSFNARVAVWISSHVGSMVCAYVFAAIGVGSLVGVFTNNVLLAAICGSFSSYFLQLVLLPILALGQNILGRHAELQAEEQYQTTLKTYHDSEQIVAHLEAQDQHALAVAAELDQWQHEQEALAQRLEGITRLLSQQQEVLFLLLEHLGIEAKLTTDHQLPIVKVGGHTTHIDEDKLRATLIRAGMKAELVGALGLPELLLLDRERPHSEEASHADY